MTSEADSSNTISPILSIIIPCHNAATTIGRCLNSITEAGVEGIEIVIVDDGSDDDLQTAVIAAGLGPAGVVHTQSKAGVSVARNLGYRLSTAPRIMFVDADDCLIPETLAGFLAAAEQVSPDICVSDFVLHTQDMTAGRSNINSDRELFDDTDAHVFQWLCLTSRGFNGEQNVGLLGGPWAKIYDRGFLEKVFPDGLLFTPGVNRGQDVLFNVEAFGHATSVSHFKKPTYVYSVSTTSASHRVADDFVQRVTTLLDHLETLIAKEGWDYLNPAVAKLRVILFDEGVRRLGRSVKPNAVRALANAKPFAIGIDQARLRDFSVGGRLKLALIRLRMYALYTGLMRLRQ